MNLKRLSQMGIYSHENSFIHKLDPRVKILTMILFIILILIKRHSFYAYFLIFIFLVVFSYVSKYNFLNITAKIKVYMYISFILLFFNIFFMNTGKLLLDLKMIKIYDIPVLFTLNIMTQIFLLTTITELFTFTTKPSDIIKGLNYILNKKRKNSETSIYIMISLQFIPIIFEEAGKIMKAQKSRGADFSRKNVKQFLLNIKEIFLIIIPLFQLTLQKSNRMSEIMEVKNFILNKERTEYSPLKWKIKDILTIIAVLLFFLFLLFFF